MPGFCKRKKKDEIWLTSGLKFDALHSQLTQEVTKPLPPSLGAEPTSEQRARLSGDLAPALWKDQQTLEHEEHRPRLLVKPGPRLRAKLIKPQFCYPLLCAQHGTKSHQHPVAIARRPGQRKEGWDLRAMPSPCLDLRTTPLPSCFLLCTSLQRLTGHRRSDATCRGRLGAPRSPEVAARELSARTHRGYSPRAPTCRQGGQIAAVLAAHIS